jgi:surfeit locus 1 family protein
LKPQANAPAAGAKPRTARSWFGLLLAALMLCSALAVLVALGTWQLHRKAWKEQLIATLTERLAAPPGALPAPAGWPRLDRDGNEYRRVAFRAEYVRGKDALVYASGSAFRPDVSGVGYWVFTPARLAGGAFVMVNRGFVPEDRKQIALTAAGEPSGPVEIVGVLRWPDTHNWFSPTNDVAHNLWFARDPVSIAAAKGVAPVAPFYVEQESPTPAGGWPQPGKLVVHLRNEHLQYAITWYGLALALVVMFVVFVARQRSGRDARDEG